MKRPGKPIQVYLSDEERNGLAGMTLRHGLSLSALIRSFVQKALAEDVMTSTQPCHDTNIRPKTDVMTSLKDEEDLLAEFEDRAI